MPFHPIPFLTVTPSVTWTSLLGDAKKSVDAVPDDSVFSGKTDNFYWGLSAVLQFLIRAPLPPADRLRGGFFFPKPEPSGILQVESPGAFDSTDLHHHSGGNPVKSAIAVRLLVVSLLLMSAACALAEPAAVTLPAEPPATRTVELEEQWRIGGDDEEDVLLGVIFDAMVGPTGTCISSTASFPRCWSFAPKANW